MSPGDLIPILMLIIVLAMMVVAYFKFTKMINSGKKEKYSRMY